MKNILIIILSILPLIIFSQNVDLDMKAHSDGQNLALRWMPQDASVWEASHANQYILKRYTMILNGNVQNDAQIQSSEVVLDSSITSLDPSTFRTKIESGVYFDTLMARVIDTLINQPLVFPNPTPSSGAEINENQQAYSDRFFIASVLADRDYTLAKDMGLGYVDMPAASGDTYKYTVEITIDGVTYNGSINIIPSDLFNVNAPKSLKAIPGDREIELRWKKLDHNYYAYNIMRSENGGPYEIVNDQPYTFSLSSDIENIPTSTIIFVDSIPQNGVDYSYQVQGLSIFDVNSDWSAIVTEQGVDPPIDFDLNLTVGNISEIGVELYWNLPVDVTKIDHYNVFKSVSPVADFVKLNDQPITDNQGFYLDQNDGRAYYYLVTLADVNGHYYKSHSKLAQADDITAPDIPRGLTVVPHHSGQIDITWDDNTEADLSGYRVYRGNTDDGGFFDVGAETITGNSFTDYVDTDVTTLDICYKILSLDNRGNYSDFSEVVCVDRPDHVGPSNPVLFAANPSKKGIKLVWETSTSRDLSHHVLQRKRNDEAIWVDVISWDTTSHINSQEYGADLNAYNYLDQSKLAPVIYNYRLVAYDTESNNSTSVMKSVRPLASKSDTQIEAYEISASCSDEAVKEYVEILNSLNAAASQLSNTSSGGNSTATILINLLANGGITVTQYTSLVGQTNQQVTNFVNGQIQSIQEKLYNENCVVELTWFFDEEKRNIQAIEIYKGSNYPTNEPNLYKVVAQEDIIDMGGGNWMFLDVEVAPKITYNYKVMMLLENGTESEFSIVKSILVQP